MLWRDARNKPPVGGAVWLPVIWIFFVGSRFVSQWLSLFGVVVGSPGTSPADGSFIDALFFLVLIVAGSIVLIRRKIALSFLIRHNVWLTIFFVYSFLAIGWSDFPFVAFKRWIKVLGHPVMALIILTEGDRVAALRTVLKRSAYLHIPLSILFIKYYPQWGRGFDQWTGQAMNRGVNLNKNELGYVCMVFSLFFFWNLLSARRLQQQKKPREEVLLSIAFLAMIWWLFSMAGSATAVACTLLGAATMVVVASPLVSKRFIGTYLIVTVLIVALSEITFGVYANVLDLLGRDASLTDRTEIWQDLFAVDINPVIGAGFESFWLGPRLDALWKKWWWHPNQAHNGYIETYLNLGWLGVFILTGVLIATFRKCRLELLRNVDFGRFRLGVLLAILTYNYTEASFKGVHLVWTLFYMIAIDYPISADATRLHSFRMTPHKSPRFGRRGVRRNWGGSRWRGCAHGAGDRWRPGTSGT